MPLQPGAEAHRHDYHQLVSVPEGTLSMQASDNDWVIAPTHALWIPAGVAHTGRVLRPGRACAIYVQPADCPFTWSCTTSLSVDQLSQQLIEYLGRPGLEASVRQRAGALLFDVLRPVTATTFSVPLPRDPRAREVAEALIDRPDDDRDLGAWGVEVNASIRTLARLFAAETGMSFAQWRAQARMRAALSLLADGGSVATVARQVGYRNPSAFTTAFRRITGQTPGSVRRGAVPPTP